MIYKLTHSLQLPSYLVLTDKLFTALCDQICFLEYPLLDTIEIKNPQALPELGELYTPLQKKNPEYCIVSRSLSADRSVMNLYTIKLVLANAPVTVVP